MTRHFEYTDLVRGPETVLDRAKEAEPCVPVAFKIEHGVDDMFQNTGTGNRAFFCDVSDDQHDRAVFLGVSGQFGGTEPDLADASERAVA